ncbi:MAG: hypothetical protein AAFR38_10275 [Planctomycetota bacterium]
MSDGKQRGESDRLDQDRINRACRAASAAYYAIVCAHARRTGVPGLLPELLCRTGPTPCACDFSDAELDDAERFLVRLGVIAER